MSINRNLFTRRKPSLRHAAAVAAMALAGLSVPLALFASGHVINVTPSLDQRLIKTTPIGEATRGDYVSFCRPLPLGNIPAGNCPDGTAPLVKRVIGIPGDTVMYSPTEIRIDGPGGWHQIHQMRHVHAGREVEQRYPHPTYGASALIMEGQLVVQGDHPMSVDSRYFGAISSDLGSPWPTTHIPILDWTAVREPSK